MSKKVKRGTYRVTFKDGVQIICGNNYKWWCTHAAEYASRRYGRWSTGGTMDKQQLSDHVERVEYSDTQFVDDGGLKYASPSAYKDIIADMSKKHDVTYAPYSQLEFESSTADRLKLRKEIEKL